MSSTTKWVVGGGAIAVGLYLFYSQSQAGATPATGVTAILPWAAVGGGALFLFMK